MAVTVEEKATSRTLNAGENPSIELTYVIRGTDGDEAALAALLAAAPEKYLNLVPKSATVSPVGPELWDGEVRYASPKYVLPEPPPTNSVSIRVSTKGGTQHITQSLLTYDHALPGETAPDYKGAIGVTHDGVQGCDITVPVLQFTVTKIFAKGNLPNLGTLFALTGTVNKQSVQFTDSTTGMSITLDLGEGLFLGADIGQARGDGAVEVSYDFAASPTRIDLDIGGIAVGVKDGWNYLWVRYEDAEDDQAKAVVKRPTAAYVEQVYEREYWSGLGL